MKNVCGIYASSCKNGFVLSSAGNMAKILVVEDDCDLSATIKLWLNGEHYDVDVTADGRDALLALDTYHYDAVVLDWDLPSVSGLQICQKLRADGRGIRIMMLTGKARLDDKEQGLESGADDYLTKPFELRELIARLRAMLRRPEQVLNASLKHGDLVLETDSYRLLKNGEEIRLSSREYALLEFFMRNPGKVFTAEALLNRIWESASESSPATVRTFIKQLRKKIDTEGQPSVIENLHGLGYRLSP